MSRAQLEKKVNDYLRKSQALEDYWQRPITAKQLQAEMDRMAKHTRQPEVLQELFEALGNDPFIIAECLARPTLAERSLTCRSEKQITKARGAPTGSYTLPALASLNTGGKYNPTTDTWAATGGAPSARASHSTVWTGSEMIVWGGADDAGSLNTGGRYNPSTDSWTNTSTTNAPSARSGHTAVWTGSEMIIWGGQVGSNTGGRYNPATDSWTATSTINAPSDRLFHTAVWTDSDMIIWGGRGPAYLSTNGKYNPNTDTWTAVSTTNAPSVREGHTAIWNGSEMIVWGGYFFDGNDQYLNTGGRYNPGTDSWTVTTTANAPTGREYHTAVWSGSEMIVWGGYDGSSLNTGGRFNRDTDSWAPTSPPGSRSNHRAVWTGSEMIFR